MVCVEESQLHRLRRADRLGGQDEIQRPLGADEPWQALRSARAGNDAERHFGQRETRGGAAMR